MEKVRRSPGFSNGVFDHGGGNIQVRQKFPVAALPPVCRLPARHSQDFFHLRNIEGEQKGPMKKREAPPSVLGVAGEFQIPQSQVRETLNFNLRPYNLFNSSLVALHDKSVGRGDTVERAPI